MCEGVRQLSAHAGLEVHQQVELAAVVHPMVDAAERHHTVRVVAAAERARHQVGRIHRALAADEAALAGDLGALRVGRRGDTGASQRRPALESARAAERRAPLEPLASAEPRPTPHARPLAARSGSRGVRRGSPLLTMVDHGRGPVQHGGSTATTTLVASAVDPPFWWSLARVRARGRMSMRCPGAGRSRAEIETPLPHLLDGHAEQLCKLGGRQPGERAEFVRGHQQLAGVPLRSGLSKGPSIRLVSISNACSASAQAKRTSGSDPSRSARTSSAGCKWTRSGSAMASGQPR
jgi:hypothetical protein